MVSTGGLLGAGGVGQLFDSAAAPLLLLCCMLMVCICVWFVGAFRDSKNGIEGACGPMLIHTDGSKNKQSEIGERERQRNGEAPSENQVRKRYMEGINDDEMLVATTHSGSMTQETFVHFAKHFVESLPNSHGPVILFLDGHGSRWNVHALNYLMENNVYPFFLASHTSIWAQPNDAGVNKRFHWCVEHEIKGVRRTCRSAPTVKYFNEALCNAVRLFRETEEWRGPI